MYDCLPALPSLYPCTLPTAPVSRSFGLRSSYEIDMLDTDDFRRVFHFLLVTIAAVEKNRLYRFARFMETVTSVFYTIPQPRGTDINTSNAAQMQYTHTEHKITFTY